MTFRGSKADKALQEKLQALLGHLLREEDNKYCADCDAKGPRWASWNLGIFVCIRCAGIHRNLGVHISRVKSVNLDAWTDEQVGSMQNMGNSKGRAVYEANLPDGFRRPQNDSALETFIRAKYEHKKYIAREWVPPTGPQKADFSVLGTTTSSSRQTAVERKLDLSSAASSVPRPSSMASLKDNQISSPSTPSASKQKSAETSAPTSPSDDLFADFISAPLPPAAATPADPAAKVSLSPDSEEKDFFNQVSGSAGAAQTTNGVSGQGSSGGKIDKASILSLYAKASPVQSPLLQQNAGMVNQLNGLTPQMVANNPFLMGGGIVAAQPQMGMQAAYAQPGLAGVNQLAGFNATATTAPAQYANQAAYGNMVGFQAPLCAAVPMQMAGLNGRVAPNLVGPLPMAGNLNMMNSQMTGPQLVPSAMMNMPTATNSFKTASSNGNALTSHFN